MKRILFLCIALMLTTVPAIAANQFGTLPVQRAQRVDDGPPPIQSRERVPALLEIVALHGELANDERFVAQAPLLGVYVEHAMTLPAQERDALLADVVAILRKLQATSSESAGATGTVTDASDKQLSAAPRYEPGAAILEVYRAGSPDQLPELPLFRTVWTRDLACWPQGREQEREFYLHLHGRTSHFLLPERAHEVGHGSYVARFGASFEAPANGSYAFSVMHDTSNAVRLQLSGVTVVEADANHANRQGIVRLEQGIHELDLFLTGKLGSSSYKPWFHVSVLEPGAFDTISVTKDRLLLPARSASTASAGSPEDEEVER